MTNAFKKKLRISLISLVAISALGLSAYPFWPLVSYHLGDQGAELNKLPTPTAYAEEEVLFQEEKEEITGNRLVIPKIGVNMPITGGNNDEYAWSLGAWIDPQTSTPDKGSNTALSAHRFQYRPPSSKTFYLLDKLEEGDEVVVYWEDKLYTYRVTGSSVVTPYAAEVLEPTDNSTITLITCTPLFSTKNRLVVTAELVEIISSE